MPHRLITAQSYLVDIGAWLTFGAGTSAVYASDPMSAKALALLGLGVVIARSIFEMILKFYNDYRAARRNQDTEDIKARMEQNAALTRQGQREIKHELAGVRQVASLTHDELRVDLRREIQSLQDQLAAISQQIVVVSNQVSPSATDIPAYKPPMPR